MRYPSCQLVFAGSYDEFDEYRLREGFSLAQAKYVYDEIDLIGLHFRPPVYMPAIGSWWERPDSAKLHALAGMKGIKLTHRMDPKLFDPRVIQANISKYL